MDKKYLPSFAYLAGMIRMGIPLVHAWNTLIPHEQDPEIKSLLEKFDDNWKTLPLDQVIRVTPTITQFKATPDARLLYEMTWVGEAIGALDTSWFGFIAILALRDRLQAGGNCDQLDIEMFQSLSYFYKERRDQMSWPDWSALPLWQNQTPIEEGSENFEALPNWLSKNRKTAGAPVPEHVRHKITTIGNDCLMQEHATRYLKMIEDAIACI